MAAFVTDTDAYGVWRVLRRRLKALSELDPEDLNLEMLLHLRGALLAKLLVINAELFKRYGPSPEHGDSLANVQDDSAKIRAMLARNPGFNKTR